jgi:hypothetical protein
MMLESATTRLAVLNTCQERISHVQKTLEFKKLQYKIPISWTLRSGMHGGVSEIGTNKCWEVLTFGNLEPKDKGMVYVYP